MNKLVKESVRAVRGLRRDRVRGWKVRVGYALMRGVLEGMGWLENKGLARYWFGGKCGEGTGWLQGLKGNVGEEATICMTWSLTKQLFMPFEEPKRVLHSTRRLFKTTSLDYSSSLEFDLFSDLENQSEEEVTEAMTEPTIEEYTTITRINYESGIEKETNGSDNTKVEWDPTNIKFENWLASKFRNHKTMYQSTKNALWDYWKRGDDEEVKTDNELSNPRDDNSIE
ncbi:hypothetical protein Tco_1301144 [Tanacetum coccineum]